MYVDTNDDVTLIHYLRNPLEIEGHPHNVYFHFCHIIFMVIMDGCIVVHFFSSLFINPMRHLIFTQFMVALEILLLLIEETYIK